MAKVEQEKATGEPWLEHWGETRVRPSSRAGCAPHVWVLQGGSKSEVPEGVELSPEGARRVIAELEAWLATVEAPERERQDTGECTCGALTLPGERVWPQVHRDWCGLFK